MTKKRARTLTYQDGQIAIRLRKRLEGITPIQRMVIFGSRARGDAEASSDMDVFLELPKLDAALRKKVSEVAWEVGLEENLVISTFVVTTEAVHSGPQAANPIFHAIEAEGIVV